VQGIQAEYIAEQSNRKWIESRRHGITEQAAAVLGVSPRRIAELIQLGKLCRHDLLGRTYVSVREILERRNAELKADDRRFRSLRGFAQQRRFSAIMMR